MAESTRAAGAAPPISPNQNGYAHPAEVAGRPIGEIGYFLALVVIAVADLAIFDQVVSIVMQELAPTLVWLTVIGFTASSLALAHAAGRIARDKVAGHGSAGKLWPVLVIWAMLGAAAFVVRLIVAVNANPADQPAQFAGAVMFLVLYTASGAVAGFGVYFTRNPDRVRYRTAFRAYRKSLKRMARSQPPYERAVSVLQVHTRGRQRDQQNYEAAKAQRLAFADELKRYSAVLIAAHLQDPSATDGMTLPDRVPFPDHPDDTD